jgi:hypothetical protein
VHTILIIFAASVGIAAVLGAWAHERGFRQRKSRDAEQERHDMRVW